MNPLPGRPIVSVEESLACASGFRSRSGKTKHMDDPFQQNDDGPGANPYAAPPDLPGPEANPRPTPRRSNWVDRLDLLFALLFVITCALGGYGATLHIETIMLSGAFILILGVLLAARGLVVPGWWLAAWTGASGPVIAAAVFIAIYANEWSPREAVQHGVPQLVLAYSLAAGILALVCLLQRIWIGGRNPQ